jgi:hypothetical protein
MRRISRSPRHRPPHLPRNEAPSGAWTRGAIIVQLSARLRGTEPVASRRSFTRRLYGVQQYWHVEGRGQVRPGRKTVKIHVVAGAQKYDGDALPPFALRMVELGRNERWESRWAGRAHPPLARARFGSGWMPWWIRGQCWSRSRVGFDWRPVRRSTRFVKHGGGSRLGSRSQAAPSSTSDRGRRVSAHFVPTGYTMHAGLEPFRFGCSHRAVTEPTIF